MKAFIFVFIFSISYAQEVTINKEWNLFGTTEELSTTFFKNDCANSVWIYNNGSWKSFAHGSEQGETFSKIKKGAGVLVYSNNGNCSLGKEIKSTKSFSNDVYPVLQNSCSMCHSYGGRTEGSEEWQVNGVTNTYYQVRNLVSTINPTYSKFLITPTDAYRHEEGGKIYDIGSQKYNTILKWIEQGAKNN